MEEIIKKFKQHFGDLKQYNTYRLDDIILFKTSDYFEIYVAYNVRTHETYGQLETIPELSVLTFSGLKKDVFKGTYLKQFCDKYYTPVITGKMAKRFLSQTYAPFIEQALKLNLPFVLKAIVSDNGNVFKNLDATSLAKATNFSPKQLQRIEQRVETTKDNILQYFTRITQIFPECKLLQDDLFTKVVDIAFSDSFSNSDLALFKTEILDKPGQLSKKLEKILSYQEVNFSEYSNLREILSDMNGLDETLFPKFPKADSVPHLICRLQCKIGELQDLENYKLWESGYMDVLPTLFDYEFRNDKYSIIVPKSISDLDIEGNALHHCVGTYKDIVSKGKEIILFLRKNNDPETPYYTIDLDPEGFIRQIHTKYNENIKDDKNSKEIQEFLTQWADNKPNLINKKSIKLSYGAKCHL